MKNKNKYIQFDVVYNNGEIKSFYPSAWHHLFGDFMKGNIHRILGVTHEKEYHTILSNF